MPPPVVVRRKRRWLVRGLALLVILCAGLWLARGPLLGPTVARVISGVLADTSGGQAHVDRATGGWLGDVALSGVEVRAAGTEPWWRFQAKNVAVEYGIRLLRGELTAVRQVRVDGLVVAIDLDRQPLPASRAPGPAALNPAAPGPSPAPWPGLIAQLPHVLPHVEVTGDVLVISAGHRVHLTGFHVECSGDQVTLAVPHLTVDGQEWPLPTISLVRSALDSFSLAQPVTLALPGLLPAEHPVQCDRLTVVLGPTSQQIVADGRVAAGTWHAVMTATSLRVSVRGVDAVALSGVPGQTGRLLVDADLERQADGWSLKNISATGLGVTLQAQATVRANPWRGTDVTANAVVDVAALKESIPALAEVQGIFQAQLTGEILLNRERWSHSQFRLSVRGENAAWRDQRCTPLQVEASVEAGRIELRALELGWNSLRASLVTEPLSAAESTSDPTVDPAADPASSDPAALAGWQLIARPIAIAGGTVTVRARGGVGPELDAHLRLAGVPLAEVKSYTGLRHVQGTVAGELHLGGTVQDPQWTGSLSLQELEAKLSPFIPTFTAGSAQCILAERVLTLVNFQSDVGGSVLTAQGRILLDGGDNALALTCHGRNLLLVQRHDARVRADLDLRLNGSFKSPLLLGEVTITSALLTPEIHVSGGLAADVPHLAETDERVVLFEFPDPPLSRLRFDVHVGSVAGQLAGTGQAGTDQKATGQKEAGESAKTDTGLRLVTRWGRGVCDVDLQLRGTGAAPAPQGRLSVREGVATLPFSTLAITHGELLFPPTDPFQPLITATAKARIRRYDVQVQVTGTVHNPIIRASGSGLDEQEALMLLTTGSTPRELQDETGRMAALGRLGGWLGQETWRTIEGGDDPEAGPSVTDRLSIEWGRESSSQGRDTIDAEFDLTNPGASPALLMTGERDRYEQYNSGFTLRWYWGGEDP